jgi:hypothetical protein
MNTFSNNLEILLKVHTMGKKAVVRNRKKIVKRFQQISAQV